MDVRNQDIINRNVFSAQLLDGFDDRLLKNTDIGRINLIERRVTDDLAKRGLGFRNYDLFNIIGSDVLLQKTQTLNARSATDRSPELDHQSVCTDNGVSGGELLDSDVVIVDFVPRKLKMKPFTANPIHISSSEEETVVYACVPGSDYDENIRP